MKHSVRTAMAALALGALAWAIPGSFALVATAAEPSSTGTAADDNPSSEAPFLPSNRFATIVVEGWNIRVAQPLLDQQAALWKQLHRELQSQLYRVSRAVPPDPLEKLRQVTVWVEDNTMPNGCMAYHPNVNWLKEHGVNPDKAKGVELGNVRHFLAWTGHQPWMLLHELAHAYHDQFLGGFDNPEIKAAYDAAMSEKLYESALLYDGSRKRAYAATNPMEYFAEATEAFFGTNDFYPFVRAELKQHDPRLAALLEKLWQTENPRDAQAE